MNKKVDFDDYTDNYNALLRESTKFFSSNEEYFAKYKIELVRSTVKQPVNRILEYGCGIGRNIQYLQWAFPEAEIIGTDISEASIAIASAENRNVSFKVEKANLDVGTFDSIFVAGVFHHIPPIERIDAAHLLAKRLKKGGSVCVFEHNPFNPVTRRIVNNCPYDADAVLLKPAELWHLLERAGLKVSRQTYCLFVPPIFSRLVWIEKYFSWLPLGGQYFINAGYP